MSVLIRGVGIFMSLCLLLSAAFAQGLMVSGTVVSNETGEPLPGAEIQLKGALIGTTTDQDGKFELSVPDQTEGKIVVSYVGYVSLEVAVRATTSNLVIRLEEDILRGSEVVVTGVATSVKRRNLANAVGTISADELVPVPAQTLERALSGKIAGLRMIQNTGAPGGGIDVNLRGISTLTGTTQPLYIIDGVIIDNSAIQSGIDAVSQAVGVGSDRPQGQPTNRIADINPNDIENIEVLKGPSAAAIYGSKANNGVVIITTKQGALGTTKIDVSQKLGFTSILKKIGFREYDAQKAAALDPENGAALFNRNGNIDYEELVYGREGLTNETSLSIRGGTARTKFYVGGVLADEDGIVQNTGYQRIGGKVNITHKFSDRVDLSVFTNYTRTESDRSITGNENQAATTLGFSLAFTPSFVDIRATNPAPGQLLDENGAPVFPESAAGSNPLQTVQLFQNNERNYRGIGSFRFNWNIYRSGNQTLDFITLGGIDFYSLENQVLSPPDLQWERGKPDDIKGESLVGETEGTTWNLYYNLAHRIKTGSSIFTTSAGVQFEERDLNNVLNRSLGIVRNQRNVDQATNVQVFQNREISRERGFYIQEEISLGEKIYLTGGVRGDASSSNGDSKKFFFFPKASASIRLTEYGVLSNALDEFKLRLAYGETGNLPDPSHKYDSFQAANTGGKGGLEPRARKGLPTVQPERAKEIEGGIDLAFWQGRGLLELTYYRQNISDLILIDRPPASSGFQEQVIQEGNEMRTQGFEASVGLTPFRSPSLSWTTRVNFFTTSSEITKLSVPPFQTGGFRLSLGQVQVKEGQSPSTIVGLDENGQIAIFGDEVPDFVVGWNNQFKLGRFNFNFLLDWSQGGEVVNLGIFLTDLGGTTEDFDKPSGIERRNSSSTGRFVESATYLKLREAGISYTLPARIGLDYIRFGVVARNLFMITDYKGYDPEVGQFGNVPIGRATDVIPFPSSRHVYFSLDFGL